jgi:hypothetical protein
VLVPIAAGFTLSAGTSPATTMAWGYPGADWGYTQASICPVTMLSVPPGCRVRPTHITGDLIGYSRGVVPAGALSGSSIAVSRSGVSDAPSAFATYSVDGTYVYRQATADSQAARLTLNPDLDDSHPYGSQLGDSVPVRELV